MTGPTPAPPRAAVPADVTARFEDYTNRLTESVAGRADVHGLVLLGSTANTARVDEWSDHDFYLIVRPGVEETFRTDLSWLPEPERIAFAVRETEHGLKVVYADGAVLEFAVASMDEAATFGGSPWRVVLDHGGVQSRMQTAPIVATRPIDDLTDYRMFLSLILIGVGRARRGEELAGGQLVRTYAAERLVGLLRRYPPEDDADRAAGAAVPVDPFNPWRRFEATYPRLGAELAAAMQQDCGRCGRRLLDIAEVELASRWPDYPHAETAVIRRALDRPGQGRNSGDRHGLGGAHPGQAGPR